ncbi:unnamed protein product [Caenorhabditis brenneri]
MEQSDPALYHLLNKGMEQNIDRIVSNEMVQQGQMQTPKTPQRSETPQTAAAHIKRPLNPFMIWSKTQRRKICEAYPDMHNAEISKQLGADWKNMSSEEREPFVKEAERLRILHTQMYPNYKFQPRKKPRGEPTAKSKEQQKKKTSSADPSKVQSYGAMVAAQQNWNQSAGRIQDVTAAAQYSAYGGFGGGFFMPMDQMVTNQMGQNPYTAMNAYYHPQLHQGYASFPQFQDLSGPSTSTAPQTRPLSNASSSLGYGSNASEESISPNTSTSTQIGGASGDDITAFNFLAPKQDDAKSFEFRCIPLHKL